MPTFLFSEHIFGPIKSRRLGSSLGINLLSVKQKVCNFNCVYCECGSTHPLKKNERSFVDKDLLLSMLEIRLQECINDSIPIDTITFAGNGEPTLHPSFLSIVNEIVRLRNKHFPEANIAVLTNGATLKSKRISKALTKVDKAIIKLDAGTDKSINIIDQPKRKLSINKLLKDLALFEGEIIIQTMFLKGTVDGKPIDNSAEEELDAWLERIREIAPKEVMLYSIDRDTPISTLERIPKEKLDAIAERVHKLGIQTQVV